MGMEKIDCEGKRTEEEEEVDEKMKGNAMRGWKEETAYPSDGSRGHSGRSPHWLHA
jgi:hypothetical protein